MALARARRDRGVDYWPGFVDALSTLVLGIIFLLTVFVGRAVLPVAGGDRQGHGAAAPERADRAAHRTAVARADQQGQSGGPDRAIARQPRQPPKPSATATRAFGRRGRRRRQRARPRRRTLDRSSTPRSRCRSARWRRSRCSTSRSRRCAASSARWNRRSKSPRRRDKESQSRIADLGQRLNVALAQRVQELSRYRSDFFGRLRAILGNRPDIRVVGDRFVFQSEVFFDAGQAVLKPEGRAELDKIAAVLLEFEQAESQATSPGCCASTAIPTCGRSRARNFPPTGICRPPAPSRSCNT